MSPKAVGYGNRPQPARARLRGDGLENANEAKRVGSNLKSATCPGTCQKCMADPYTSFLRRDSYRATAYQAINPSYFNAIPHTSIFLLTSNRIEPIMSP